MLTKKQHLMSYVLVYIIPKRKQLLALYEMKNNEKTPRKEKFKTMQANPSEPKKNSLTS